MFEAGRIQFFLLILSRRLVVYCFVRFSVVLICANGDRDVLFFWCIVWCFNIVWCKFGLFLCFYNCEIKWGDWKNSMLEIVEGFRTKCQMLMVWRCVGFSLYFRFIQLTFIIYFNTSVKYEKHYHENNKVLKIFLFFGLGFHKCSSFLVMILFRVLISCQILVFCLIVSQVRKCAIVFQVCTIYC